MGLQRVGPIFHSSLKGELGTKDELEGKPEVALGPVSPDQGALALFAMFPHLFALK